MARLDDLTDPQFEEYLSSLYLTMLRLGTPTREALIEAGIHPEDLDRGAAFLESRQLITRLEPGAWDILAPETALPRLASALEQRARSVRNTAAELGALWRKARHEPEQPDLVGVQILRSVDQVVLAAHGLVATAQERVRAFLDDSPAARRLLLDDPGLIAMSGVSPSATSLTVDVTLLGCEEVLPRLEAAATAGQGVAVGVGVPFTGLVVDDKAALIDVSRHDARADGSFVVRRRGPVEAVGALFDATHDVATPMRPTLAHLAPGA